MTTNGLARDHRLYVWLLLEFDELSYPTAVVSIKTTGMEGEGIRE